MIFAQRKVLLQLQIREVRVRVPLVLYAYELSNLSVQLKVVLHVGVHKEQGMPIGI